MLKRKEHMNKREDNDQSPNMNQDKIVHSYQYLKKRHISNNWQHGFEGLLLISLGLIISWGGELTLHTDYLSSKTVAALLVALGVGHLWRIKKTWKETDELKFLALAIAEIEKCSTSKASEVESGPTQRDVTKIIEHYSKIIEAEGKFSVVFNRADSGYFEYTALGNELFEAFWVFGRSSDVENFDSQIDIKKFMESGIETANIEALRYFVFDFTNQERFQEGNFGNLCDTGVIERVVNRLKQIAY